MRIWTQRPRLLHLGFFFAAYMLGCVFASLMDIVPGTNISIWPPAGVFVATLILAPPRTWPWWILAGCPAELLSQAIWFHSPLVPSFIMYLGNVAEAVVGASLVTRACGGRPVHLDTLREVVAFVVLGAGVAPVMSATVGAATLHLFDIRSQTFAAAWPLWWIGDATGVLIVAPLALAIFQTWRAQIQLSAGRWIEAILLGLTFLGVASLSLSGALPFAYIVMPPLLWAAVRFEFKGAAVALTILVLFTAGFTITGAGEFAGDAESQREKQMMLQLFLVISALSALIVAAISRQHQLAVATARQSERSLRNLLETLPVQVWCTDPAGEPTYFSPQFRNFVGFDVDDWKADGRVRPSAALSAIIHPEDFGAVHAQFARSLATGEPYALKHRLRRHDGRYRWVETRAAALRDAAGVIVTWNGVCLDIDDQMRAQEELRLAQDSLARASQAASLAELSASIAHEINQPLAAIVANSQACHRWLSADPPNIERAKITADRIARDANSAADVISHIRALFRQAPHDRARADVNDLIREVRRLMVDEIAGKGIQVDLSLERGLPPPTLDRVQAQQVLLNLIRNGVQAMDHIGDRPRLLEVRSRREGADEILVEVQDAGDGFQDAERAFDPFFTTKPNGMGMGLTICRSIIESHGGRLWMRNDPKGGAVVAFTLPLTTNGPERTQSPSETADRATPRASAKKATAPAFTGPV